jgi:hypothetical protein
MSQVIDGEGYKCRSKVLAAFFKKSRDRWKLRCLETKRFLKRLTNRAAWLETSRDEWKAYARQLEDELRQLRGEQNTTRLGNRPTAPLTWPTQERCALPAMCIR